MSQTLDADKLAEWLEEQVDDCVQRFEGAELLGEYCDAGKWWERGIAYGIVREHIKEEME